MNTELNPTNYNPIKVKVYFEIGGFDNESIKKEILSTLEQIDFLKNITAKEFGFEANLFYQEIPEVLRILENFAFYQVIIKEKLSENK